MVKWSCGHVVMWPSDQVVKWSWPFYYLAHVSDNVKRESTHVISTHVIRNKHYNIFCAGILQCIAIIKGNPGVCTLRGALNKSKWRPHVSDKQYMLCG